MKLKDLKIESQLIIGFGTMLVLVILLGVVAYRQSNKIHEQTELIYNHPFKVREGIGTLQVDILNIRVGMRDLMVSKTDDQKQNALEQMNIYEADVLKQFDMIRDQYLGPQKDIEEAYQAFLKWNTAYKENLRLFENGQIEKVITDLSPTGSTGILREKMMKEINDVEEYAQNKTESFYQNSAKINQSLNFQLLYIVICILILMVIINYYLLRNTRNPIKELSDATKRFQNGDLNARSIINSKNEYGELSDSFNSMVDSIQANSELTKKTTELSQVMLLEEEPHKFFATVLPVLASQTNSQMAAVYLLSENKKQFEHFESFGMSGNSKLTFDVNNFEGEFGSVLSTRKIQTIKRIPVDTRFLFHTVSGKLVPREIITIPIISGNEIIAIISLASVRTYSNETTLLVNNFLNTLTARIEGVLSYQKIQTFAKQLEFQNTELEAQKTEMSAQSSELLEQNRELEMQKIQLSEASRLKTNFLSNMSHELRTPLNSVIALSGVLNRRLANKIPADEYSYLEVIERNGKHLLLLINDILDISRIEAGREEIEITKFSSKNLIEEVVSMIHPQAKQKRIQLIQKPDDKDVMITGDIDKCRHILQNLVGNAVKFTEKGLVEISVEQQKNKIAITVKDTGIGISENNLPHIFDEFRQADAGTSRKFGGTGLGLAIAKKYANLLGGTIEVKSKLGEGSSFTVTLPLNYASENRIIETLTDLIKINQVKPSIITKTAPVKTILLVDDSEPAIIQLKDFMEDCGYRILVAHGGPEALEIILQTIPDAMILDLMMPGMDGFEVLQTIRNEEATSHIPVLILTAKHITKEDLRFLKHNNVHQLIQKGDVNRNELLNSVASLVLTDKKEVEKSSIEIRQIDGKPVILIVEDNPDNMTTAKAVLENNFTILEAVDGNQGIFMAKKHTPHLILMDIALPGMDGIEAFNIIRNTGPLSHIPVVALTASAMTMDRETILAHGFDGYIAKPIDEKIFFNTINKVLYGK
jgi:signal transduction histidine kinase/DNA-binding response OmpR family regulator/HAMP domain-containing protein